MAKWSHKLPAVLNPVGDICVEVTIPAHPDYVALFVRAVRMLEINRMYERDEALSAITVVDQWRRRTITPLIESLAEGTGMCGVDGECLAYPPFANFISYYPQNPYTEPDLIPEGFEAPPFYVNGMDNEHDLPNYERGDVIVNFAAINLELSWDLEKSPRIELCLEGSGVVEIHLLKTVQGGAAVITVDNPLDLGDIIAGIIGDGIEIISLNQDIVSLPPETAEEVILEIPIETEGEHTLYIYYLPTLDDSLIPLFFGGGIREISLCGNIRPCGMPAPEPPPPLEGVEELKPEFQFTADCGLEYRLRDQEDNIVQDWQPVPGWVDNAAACFGAGGSMATKEDIRDGIYEAFNRLAAQVVSGRYLNIEIGEDGTVTDPTEDAGGGDVPEDDPLTPDINEELEARTGGAIFLTNKLDKILLDMFTWFATYTAPSTGVTPQMAEDRLQLLYGFEQTAANTFANYWYTVYMNTSGAVDLNDSVLDSLFFCKGISVSTLARYIFENHSTPAELPVLEVFAECLTQEQLDGWFQEGLSVPSKAYETYSCTKIDPEQVILNMSTAEIVQVTTAGTWKQNHRFRCVVSGSFTDSDNANIVRDFFWEHNTSTGAKTYRNTNPFIAGATDGAHSAAQVPFESSHIYNVIVEKTGTSTQCIVSCDNAPFNLPNTTGTITIDIEDLGEFAI